MSLVEYEADVDSFRAALGSFATSVNVITTLDPEGRACGMTATAFTSVSTDPLLVLACVNRSTRTYDYIAGAGRFAVNILGADAREISDYCAKPGADKGLDPAWLQSGGPWESPALAGALVVLDCAVDQNVSAGTHGVLIGRVLRIGMSRNSKNDEPLLHFRGAYRQLQLAAQTSRPKPLPIVLEDLS